LQFAIRNLQFAIPIILGNPPFSSLSTNTNAWIARLVRGDDEVRGYTRAGDERLGERKTWLHDDYVKFIRLAQWHVEAAGQGIVGFVTNRGYLDNATFRLMRQELLRVFPLIHLVDLHGNRKGGDVSSDGQPDENVFGLDQGIAIGLFVRPPTPTRSASEEMETRSVSEGDSRVEYDELWGARDEKLAALASCPCLSIPDAATPSLTRRATIVAPTAPDWRFVPTTQALHPEYAAAWSLVEAMPLNTTAPVTARDHFVVAFTPAELHQRIAEFRDLSIPDDVIRQRYFTRTRSSRYQRGDTRSWKLAAARQAVAADADWQAQIVRCLYRPFDWRWVFWHPAMIDWPRNEVTRLLIEDQGVRNQESGVRSDSPLAPSPQPLAPLCLIARRQQLPTQPCTYFWISDGLALDGVIRSDNRGSESLFPRWRMWSDRPDRTSDGNGLGRMWESNFSSAFLEQFAACIGSQPEPDSVLAYIYALFHSPTYRERYAAELRCDFPRILLPGSKTLYESLATIGLRLIELHLLRDAEGVGSLCPNSTLQDGESLPGIDSRPLDAGARDAFRVGGYTVLKKWLQPKHRSSGDPQYAQIAAAIGKTIELMARIDAIIAEQGGFPAAFARGAGFQPADVGQQVGRQDACPTD
jgi:predicted helicase